MAILVGHGRKRARKGLIDRVSQYQNNLLEKDRCSGDWIWELGLVTRNAEMTAEKRPDRNMGRVSGLWVLEKNKRNVRI